MAGSCRYKPQLRGRLACVTLLAGALVATPAFCDPPPADCTGAGGAKPANGSVQSNPQFGVMAAYRGDARPPPFPPPGVDLDAGAPGAVVLHDSLSPEERAGLDAQDKKLARKLGGEARAAALDYFLGQSPGNEWGVAGSGPMLWTYITGYSQQELTPDIAQLIAAHYWQGTMFSHRTLLSLPQAHRYHSRALFERIAQELAVTHDGEVQELAQALTRYDEPEAPDLLITRLDRLPPLAVAVVAGYLLYRGDARGIAIERQALALLDGMPQQRDYYLDEFAYSLPRVGTPRAFAELAGLLRLIQHDPPGPRRDDEMTRWSVELLYAPRAVHIDLAGIDPAPACASSGAQAALDKLLHERPSAEALVADRTAEHLRQLIEMNDIDSVREYLAQHFDVNAALDASIIATSISQAMLETLLQGGADPRKRDAAGNDWLHLVCKMYGLGPPEQEAVHVKMAQSVIAAGADVNAANNDGLTPLMLAAEFHHPQILRLLLQAGARTDAVDKTGRTAMIITLQREYQRAGDTQELQGILLQGGAAHEYRYRLSHLPQHHPLWSFAALILVVFFLGYGLAGLGSRGGTTGQGLPGGAWRAYFIVCGLAAVPIIGGLVSIRGASGDAAIGVIYVIFFILIIAAVLAAVGAFMSGLHFGRRQLRRLG